MAVQIYKEKVISEDIDFGFDPASGTRTGNQFNASFLPYTASETVTEALDNRYTSAYLDANFAPINGNSANLFEVATPTTGTHSTTKDYVDTLVENIRATLDSDKADKSNVLELDNNDAYSPLFDYNPSTKKYVDDSIFTAFQQGVSGQFTSADGKTITITNGLVTGIL